MSLLQKTLLTATNKYALAGAFPNHPPPRKSKPKNSKNMSDPPFDPKHDVAPAGYARTITDLEDQTWRAMQQFGDGLLRFLSPDCVMLFPLGLQVSHHSEPNIEDVLTSAAFVPWERYAMLDVKVIPLGARAATITYLARATRPEAVEFKALISSTWRRVADGSWEMCVHQQTPFDQGLDELEEDDY